MLKIECFLVDRRTVDHLPHKRHVVRMHPVENDIDRNLGRGVVLEYAVTFLGPADLSTRNVPAKTAGVAEPLRLCQIGFADLQRRVKLLEIPYFVLQISARLPKRLGCVSLRSDQSNDKEGSHRKQGKAR